MHILDGYLDTSSLGNQKECFWASPFKRKRPKARKLCISFQKEMPESAWTGHLLTNLNPTFMVPSKSQTSTRQKLAHKPCMVRCMVLWVVIVCQILLRN